MKKIVLVLLCIWLAKPSFSQKAYTDSIKQYISKYVQQHEVVKGSDKKHMHFFDVDPVYRVQARLERKENMPWFAMPTSGSMKQMQRVFGVLHFRIRGKDLQLNLYQSQSLMGTAEYKDFLFLPFTDATTGKSTYDGGRYIDLVLGDIKNNVVTIDFNKAYNPYCAYVSGIYNCPIPPRENQLAVEITAGEKKYDKH